jgi:hypothetical protein
MSAPQMNDIELRLAVKFLRYRASVGTSVVISHEFAAQLADHLEAGQAPAEDRKSA